jgi:hypothetical protein
VVLSLFKLYSYSSWGWGGGGPPQSWKILLEEKLLTGILQIKSSDVFPEIISQLARFAWELEAGTSGR